MVTAKDRVKQELRELEEKLDKLAVFRGTDKYDSLSEQMQMLLVAQQSTMNTYIAILRMRLAIWED